MLILRPQLSLQISHLKATVTQKSITLILLGLSIVLHRCRQCPHHRPIEPGLRTTLCSVMAGVVERLDAQLERFFAGWNIWSTLLALLILVAFLYPLFSSQDPDTHPLLLSRQANVAAVRQPGESAVYRALEVPHGYPLKSGLNVKSKGASRWSAGRDGDLRDIWRRIVGGPESAEGESTGPPGKILTVFGKEDIEDHDLHFLSRQINVLGQFIKQQGGSNVAIYLPNSLELLLTIFGLCHAPRMSCRSCLHRPSCCLLRPASGTRSI